MRLSEYLKIRNGVNGNKSLTKGEARGFGVDTSKKGWWKEDKELPFSTIAILARRAIENSPHMCPKVRRNLQIMECPPEKDEKYLYLFVSPLNMSKVGISKSPAKRLLTLTTQTGVPLKMVATWEVADAFGAENHIHKSLDGRMLGEWFRGILTPEDIEAVSGKHSLTRSSFI